MVVEINTNTSRRKLSTSAFIGRVHILVKWSTDTWWGLRYV